MTERCRAFLQQGFAAGGVVYRRLDYLHAAARVVEREYFFRSRSEVALLRIAVVTQIVLVFYAEAFHIEEAQPVVYGLGAAQVHQESQHGSLLIATQVVAHAADVGEHVAEHAAVIVERVVRAEVEDVIPVRSIDSVVTVIFHHIVHSEVGESIAF